MKNGIELIAQERQEQIHKHKRTIIYDVLQNKNFQLSDAAGKLAWHDIEDIHGIEDSNPDGWDWELWNKMIDKPYKERLIIAGALIAAEIDRIQNV